MLPQTLQFILVMVAAAINDRLQHRSIARTAIGIPPICVITFGKLPRGKLLWPEATAFSCSSRR